MKTKMDSLKGTPLLQRNAKIPTLNITLDRSALSTDIWIGAVPALLRLLQSGPPI